MFHVCLSDTIVSPAKTAEPIEMLFGLWIWVGPRNHVLDGGSHPHGKGQFRGGRRPIVKIGTLSRELCKTAKPIEMPFGVWDSGGPKYACIRCRWTLSPPGEYEWTVHIRRQCGLFVKLLWPLVGLAGLSGSALVSINKVTLRRAWLVLGWVTVCGRVNHLGLSPATQANSAFYPQRDGKWVPPKVRWRSAAGSKGRCGSFHLWINLRDAGGR